MRKFLNTLYVLNKDAYLSLEGENIVLLCNKTEIGRVPLHTLEGIVCFSYPGASPALMGKCARLGVDLSFFSPQGRFLARAVGEERGNVLLRQTQYRIADSEAESCLYARNFILGKVYNARWVLERATRDHPQRVPVEQLKRTSAQLAAALPLIEQCDDLDQLRGLEGEAAQRYFDYFDSLILQQHDDFSFAGRSRRPPLDNTNALLSFAYSLLASDCTAALQSVGLDPYVGFLHRARPGRRSLALDQLRGLEGEAAQRYFDYFDSLILQQHDDFSFAGRSRRPPLDNTNALLSFAYSLLASDCTAALQSVGLDPYVGFLHRARPGRRSLALDLMEELRAVYADRFVLSCINQKIMTPKHFQKQENGAVLLTDEGRRAFLGGWQTRKQETITHPFLNEKLPWGLVPYVQALLLARTLRGDMELYPPFFWK